MKQRSLSVLLLVSATAIVAAGCTPLHKMHVNDRALAPQDTAMEHAYGGGRALREPVLSVASGTTAPVAIEQAIPVGTDPAFIARRPPAN